MGDNKIILEFIAKLIDDTNSKRIIWDKVDCIGDSDEYHTIYDDEYHLLFRIEDTKEKSYRLRLFEIIGIPIGEIDTLSILGNLYDAILVQGGNSELDKVQ